MVLALLSSSLAFPHETANAAQSAAAPVEKPYVVDYVGSYQSHWATYWMSPGGGNRQLSEKGSVSFTFALGQLVTPTGSWYDPAKGKTSLVLSGTIQDTIYSKSGNTSCTAKLSASPDPKILPTLTFNSPTKGDVTVSTLIPEAELIVSSATVGTCAYSHGEEIFGDPGLAPAQSAALSRAISPSLILTPHQQRAESAFDASASGAGGSASVHARMTVEPASPYVALGDSFSSGDDSRAHYDADSTCWRSSDAYPVDYSSSAIFLACSGASPQQILANQVPLIPPTARVVSITAGGDDPSINLFLVLEQCILDVDSHAGLSSCKNHMSAGLRNGDAFGQLRQTLVDLFHAIHRQAPLAKLYVLGYPVPVPQRITGSGCPGLAPKQFPGWLLLADHDLPTLHSLVERLDATVESAAGGAAGTIYVAPFTGQDVCAAESAFFPMSGDFGFNADPAPLHPDAVGQHEMATLLRKVAGPPPVS